jgi:hypothetical protein
MQWGLKIHASIGWLLNTEESKDHFEILQIVLAKGQSRKNMLNGFGVA